MSAVVKRAARAWLETPRTIESHNSPNKFVRAVAVAFWEAYPEAGLSIVGDREAAKQLVETLDILAQAAGFDNWTQLLEARERITNGRARITLERRRRKSGPKPAADAGPKRRDYMREYMARKRAEAGP